jgi:hypothetical protein
MEFTPELQKFIELMKIKTKEHGNEIVLKFKNGQSLVIDGDNVYEREQEK